MLKRNGEVYQHATAQNLNRGETDAYNEAFDLIKAELEALRHVRDGVREMRDNPVVFTIPGGSAAGAIIETRNVPVDRWEICSTLLNLRNSRVFLCKRAVAESKAFAVIQTYPTNSAYAQANGDAEVLMAGDDPVELVQDYAVAAQHTLRLMAGNLVARAHKAVWARFANTSPVRVINVISEDCDRAATLTDAEPRQKVASNDPARATVGQRT